MWDDCEIVVKLGLLNDDKFAQKAKEFLVWKTTKGSYITADSSKETYIYVSDDQVVPTLVPLYEQKGIRCHHRQNAPRCRRNELFRARLLIQI